MKHKHAEMIKAKVDNMELVLLVSAQDGWRKSCNDFPTLTHLGYFLCHPKHVNETIHWLNGGEVEFAYKHGDWEDFYFSPAHNWGLDFWYMREDFKSRIKPKKEKRWIIVSKSQGSGVGVIYNDCSGAYKFESDAIIANNALSELNKNTQIIEIEIEVE